MVDLDGDGIAESASLVIEDQRTNYFAHSDIPRCQGVRLPPGPYVLSMIGKGSLTIDEHRSVESRMTRPWPERLFSWPWRPWQRYGPLRAEVGQPLRFEVLSDTMIHDARTVEIHIHGNVKPRFVQVEEGTFPSSYIPTSGKPVTRMADSLSFPIHGRKT